MNSYEKQLLSIRSKYEEKKYKKKKTYPSTLCWSGASFSVKNKHTPLQYLIQLQDFNQIKAKGIESDGHAQNHHKDSTLHDLDILFAKGHM